jgi:hypothetical protein
METLTSSNKTRLILNHIKNSSINPTFIPGIPFNNQHRIILSGKKYTIYQLLLAQKMLIRRLPFYPKGSSVEEIVL